MDKNIPCKIHYCWFGRSEKPKIVNKCIESWKKVLKGYEIIEWNEDNFDINCNEFVKQAYNAKKYAFVSDYVRLYALYNEGGIYLDTDVEVIKTFDDFLHNNSFWGYEEKNRIATSTFGAKPNNELIRLFMEYYESNRFIREDGSYNMITNVEIITNILKNLNLRLDGNEENILDLGVIYKQDYFSPYDYINLIDKRNENTYAIHHFCKSWLSAKYIYKHKLKVILSKIIGGQNIYKIRKFISK